MEIDQNFIENFSMNQTDNPFFYEYIDHLKNWSYFHNQKDTAQLFYVTKNENLYLYFGSKSKTGFFSLHDEVKALLGFYFNGEPINLDNNDYHENLLSKLYFNELSFKLILEDKNERLIKKINLYFKILKDRPTTKSKIILPFGQIRNLFDQAVLTGDEINANIFKQQMLENNNDGRLTPSHELFLNIRMKSGLEQWDQISLNDLRTLKDYKDQIPLKIIKDIAKFFYIKGIEKFENSNDFMQCKNYLSENLHFNEFLNFFSTRFNSNDKYLLNVMLLSELFKDSINMDYIQYIYDQFKEADLTNLIVNLKQHLISTENIEDNFNYLKAAMDADFDQDYDKAFELFLKCKPDAKILYSLIRCLRQKFVGNIEDWLNEAGYDKNQVEKIINLFENLNDDEKLKFVENKQHHDLYLKITQSIVNDVGSCNSWTEWINNFENNLDKNNLISLLKENGESWDLQDFKNNPNLLDLLKNILYKIEKFTQVQNDFYEIFVKNTNISDPIYIDFFNTLFERILLKTEITIYDLQFCNDIQLIILNSEPTLNQYKTLLEHCLAVEDKYIGLNNFDLILDLTERFMIYPKPDQIKLSEFYNKVINLGLRHNQLLKDRQRDLLINLQVEHFPDQPNSFILDTQMSIDQNQDNLSFLENKTLAIYTLVEGVGRRVKNFINSKIPSCNITINSDKECNTRLKTLASHSDYFVFAWKASKHQAFYCITDERKKDELIQPLGKGSSSIIRSLLEYNNS